jgi:HSP20 family protein
MFVTCKAFRAVVPAARSIASKTNPRKRSDLMAMNDFPLARSLAPARDIFGLFNNFDLLPTFPSTSSLGTLQTDIKETEKSYEIAIDLPGVDKKDIQISHRDNDLIVSAERSGMKKEENENFRRVERFTGHVSRAFALPTNADPDNIQAECKDGVLSISIPKTEHERESKRIEVK